MHKLLRRVCAQHTTGIRKPFFFEGKRLAIIIDRFDPKFVGLHFMDFKDRYNIEELTEVTPDSIITAIRVFEVRQVMES